MSAVAVAVALRLVQDAHALADIQVPAGELHASADVEILAVHEKARVEAFYLAEGFCAEKHEKTCDPCWAGRRPVAGASPLQDFQGG